MVFLLNAATPISKGWRSFTPEHSQRQYFKLWSAQKLPCVRTFLGALSHRRMGTGQIHTDKAAESTPLPEVFIDKSKFDVPYNLLALRVPKQHSGSVSKMLSGYVFDMPRVRHIVPDPSNSDARLVILSEKITDSSLSELPVDRLESLRSVTEIEVVPHQVVLGYDYWPADHILKGLLPDGCEIQSSFETIGHIAHLNIRDEVIPYKHLIASVILEKNKPKIRTILNKVGTITNQFRVPTFEVLAGDQSLVSEVKQHGATFRLDYGLVYWNSRLEHEHTRLVSEFRPKQVICDMFAGIGPFAIPAAQKGCIVYANDLNPHSTKYLKLNSEINKVSNRVHVYNMDAREFVRQIVTCKDEPPSREESQSGAAAREGGCERKKNGLSIMASEPALSSVAEEERNQTKSRGKKMQVQVDLEHGRPWEHIDHVVMNLPASALEFLDVFHGLLSKERWNGTLPRVHCYCFMRAHETITDVLKRAEKVLNGTIQNPNVWEVRDVAPNKAMLCLSFDLPPEVAFGESTSKCAAHAMSVASGFETTIKKPRLESGLSLGDG
eukprot:c24869_g1_i1 orf=75-1730(+)